MERNMRSSQLKYLSDFELQPRDRPFWENWHADAKVPSSFELILDLPGSFVDFGSAVFPPQAPGLGPVKGAQSSSSLASGTEQLIIEFVDGSSAEEQSATLAALNLNLVKTIAVGGGNSGDIVVVEVAAPLVSSILEYLGASAAVQFAELNAELAVQAFSNDSSYTSGSMWGMYGDQTSPANSFGSQAGEAWMQGATGSTTSVVGVIDTGLDYTHVDLYLNVWLNQGEIPVELRGLLADVDQDGLITFWDLNDASNAPYVSDLNGNQYIDAGDLLLDLMWEDGVDTDGNGFRDDLVGWDFVNNDNDPFDDNGHGTHVSGTIGALGGNGLGVAGVNWQVQIMALKFLSASGSGSTADAVEALNYFTAASIANDAGGGAANFVATNNSWGGGGASQAMLNAIVDSGEHGALFIAAAGNSGLNNNRYASYPANYSTVNALGFETVVSVAAITSSGSLASYSNYGSRTVDLGAPGSSIISTTPNNGYSTYSGTSMATPHVTGALALLASLAPDLTAAELRDTLLSTATPTSSLSRRTETGGRLDVQAMIDSVDTTPPPNLDQFSTVPLLSFFLPDQVAMEDEAFSVVIPDGMFTDADAGDSLAYSASLESGAPLPSWLKFNASTLEFSGTPLNADVGTLNVKVTATDLGGNSVSDVFAISIANTNDAPVLVGTVDDQSAAVGSDFELVLQPGTFIDPDVGDTLIYSATLSNGATLPDWLTFNQSTLTFSGSPAADNIGTISVTVTATDPHQAAASVTFNIVVSEVPLVNYIWGTTGSDNLVGTAFDDIISGIPQDGTNLGRRTVDYLTGGDGNDIFVLGDQRGMFYDDLSSRRSGTTDYAVITDFTAGDLVQLSAGSYWITQTSINNIFGVGIYIDTNNNGRLDSRDEFTGILKDKFLSEVSAADFLFV